MKLMLMPALLPKNLEHYSDTASEERLFNVLKENHADLVNFFCSACDDETWSNTYSTFMKQSIELITQAFFIDRLDAGLARSAAKAIQKHFENLKTLLYSNISCNLR